MRTARLALVLLLGATVPACFLPELIVVGADSGVGGSGADATGGQGSGGEPPNGTGGGASGGTPDDGSGGGADSGGGSDGNGSGSGSGSGGEGSGGGSGGAGPLTGYYQSGPWHGFVSSEVDYGTLTSTDLGAALAPPYCMSGSLQPEETELGAARFAWNLNQDASCVGTDCSPAISTISPSKEGIVLRFDNPGGSPLRVQIEAPDAASDPSARFCTEVTAAEGVLFLPWSEFNTQCWAPANGTVYQNQPIERLVVLVPGPGLSDEELTFDYCVEIVGEANPPDGICATADGPGLGTFSLADAASASVLRRAHPYAVQGDLWGGSSGQVIQGTGTAFEVTTAGAASAGTFPATFIGKIGNQDVGTALLPNRLFDLSTVTTYWKWSGPLGAGAVALYEVRFSLDTNATEPPSHVVQVWLAATGRSPGGTPDADFVSGGTSWGVFSSVIEGAPTITYLAPQTTNTFEGDLAALIMHAMEVGDLSTDEYITSVSAGFQISSGGGIGLKVEDFCMAFTATQ